MHAVCDAEFSGSHLCHASEYYLTAATDAVPADGAWIDLTCAVSGSSFMTNQDIGATNTGAYTGLQNYSNCGNWASANGSHLGLTITATNATTSGKNCDEPRPLACCDSPFLETFAGFTTATYDGDQGGRGGLHLACATEFPGSHACHSAEYERTKGIDGVPADGAWIDLSAAVRQSSTSITTTSDCAAPEYGPYTGLQNYTNCGNWSSDNSSHLGLTVTSTNHTTSGKNCDELRPIACCE